MNLMLDHVPEGRKTARVFGAIFTIVRDFAAHHAEFTPNEIPGLTRDQAQGACYLLRNRGELKVIRAGTKGRLGLPAVYAAVNNQPQ